MFSLLQKILCSAFILLFALINHAYGHARLLDPPARSSAWRFDSRFPIEYTDMQMWCGGMPVQYGRNGGKCGICGEEYSAVKLWEKGGVNYRGFSVRTYNMGQKINVYAEITANHLGYVEFRICNIDGWATDATQECLDKTLLKDELGSSRFTIPEHLRHFNKTLVLPSGLTCRQCVLQWKYNTGNNWGTDPVTGTGCLGCGDQEQFYGCADVTITSSGAPNPNPAVKTTVKPAPVPPGLTTRRVTPTTTTTRRVTPPSTTTSRVTPSTTRKSGTKCFNGDGMYADLDSNCQKFYVCVFAGTAFEHISHVDCVVGTIFDSKLKTCIWKEQATCA